MAGVQGFCTNWDLYHMTKIVSDLVKYHKTGKNPRLYKVDRTSSLCNYL